MGTHITDIRRANEKAIGVVMLPIGILGSSIITIMMKAELRRIPLPNKVLSVEIRDHDVPMTKLERVQLAVGIFFQ